jgi:uncharacterized protein (TIGR00251 family)
MPSLSIRVSTGARRDEIAGWLDDALRIRVRAAPERGKANEAVCELIASALGVPVRAVTIVRGHTSRDKVVSVNCLTGQEMLRRLGKPML